MSGWFECGSRSHCSRLHSLHLSSPALPRTLPGRSFKIPDPCPYQCHLPRPPLPLPRSMPTGRRCRFLLLTDSLTAAYPRIRRPPLPPYFGTLCRAAAPPFHARCLSKANPLLLKLSPSQAAAAALLWVRRGGESGAAAEAPGHCGQAPAGVICSAS